VNLRRQICC